MVNLRAERLNRGMSSAAAATEMGISKQVLLNAENRLNVPRPETALKIAEFYGYAVTDIWPVERPEKAAA